jgi:asparagine synthase (glutamine-hydrolysing)
MTRALVHRGPDDEGLWAADGVAMGMRRLSIIDLAGGHQPMWTADGVGIVFNGEIYNYKALRQELVDDGYVFGSQSDTEVILKLYHRHGLAAMARLEGMFGICIYDPRQNAMHLVRDRMGVKPLYFGQFDGRLLFASEIKAILTALPQRPALDLQSFHHYLTFRFVPGPATIWQGIEKLEPGSILTINLSSMELSRRRYWNVHFESETVTPGRDYQQEFEELFLGAVEKRLVAADVPVGVLLSGGLDSSAVSAAAVELGHRDLHTFSVSFVDGGPYDESPYARKVARHIGSRHHEIAIGQKEFLDFLPQMVHHSDEPMADLASVPLYYVSRLARGDVKVVLSGEGADEVLAGYNMEQLAVFVERLRRLDRLPKPLLRLGAAIIPGAGRREILKGLSADGWQRCLSRQGMHMTHHWSEEEKHRLWRDRTAFASSDALLADWYAQCPSRHPLDQLQEVYCRHWLVEDLLMKADKMSMATSLELREPFLDHRLVEWAARLPLAWKVGDRRSGPVSKRVLREFARRRLPESILTRPKQGFPVPAYQWLQTSLGAWAEDLLFSPSARSSSLWNMQEARPVLARARAGDGAAAHKIWLLLLAEHWLRAWT